MRNSIAAFEKFSTTRVDRKRNCRKMSVFESIKIKTDVLHCATNVGASLFCLTMGPVFSRSVGATDSIQSPV